MMERRAFLFFAPGRPAAVATVAVVAAAATLAGSQFVVVPDHFGARWLPAGIGLALLLVLGMRAWPALLLGTLGANLVVGVDGRLALALATAATAEAYAGAHLARRWAGGRRAMARTRSFVLLTVGGIVASFVGPALGSVAAAWLRHAPATVDGSSLLLWRFGDVSITLVLAPLILMRQLSTSRTGIAVYPRDGRTPQVLLAAADVVLYGAKVRRVRTPLTALHA